MSSPLSSSDAGSAGFHLLDHRIQRWIWSKGWTTLRDAQEQAIPVILEGRKDVIIAAATAAGKTEAAFLPILTRLLQNGEELGLALYISPLKALINDQWERLELLCQELEVPVVPWHGDINDNHKKKFRRHPHGALLITPESLEAMFVRRGHEIPRLFSALSYIVIDELHAFIGSDRGKQLQSLLHRLEVATELYTPRIGLSATLGNMKLAADYLRPGAADAVHLIVSGSTGQELKVQVRGYQVATQNTESTNQPDDPPDVHAEVAGHLYKVLRGTNNLVFPNSRRMVEHYSDMLRRHCEADGVPNEFWPHHGSLARGIREDAEKALKAGDRPATGICTNTLELGIDIGAVKSIAQVGAPPSVAAIRQRLGRSGRRAGEPAILRAYCIENLLDSKSSLSDRLRESLVQTTAMIRLLMRGWFEPPLSGGLHLSTLVQQLLSMIAERGGVVAEQAYDVLVRLGPFSGLEKEKFIELLRALGQHDLIMQDRTGLLLLGQTGERMVASHDFYAAFASKEEWQIACDGRVLGTLPVESAVTINQRIIFAGRRWQITHIDEPGLVLTVVSDPGGLPPRFNSGGASTHDIVRAEMQSVLRESTPVNFLDERALMLLSQARDSYKALKLDSTQIVVDGNQISVLTWRGDLVNEALVLMLRGLGAKHIDNDGLIISLVSSERDRLEDALSDIAQMSTADTNELLKGAENLRLGKWDWALPESLVIKSYASLHLDIPGAIDTARTLTASP